MHNPNDPLDEERNVEDTPPLPLDDRPRRSTIKDEPVATPLELLKAWMATVVIPVPVTLGALVFAAFLLFPAYKGLTSGSTIRQLEQTNQELAKTDRCTPDSSDWIGTRIGRARSPANAAAATRRSGHRLGSLFVAAALSRRQKVQSARSHQHRFHASRPSHPGLLASKAGVAATSRSASTRKHDSFGTRASQFPSKSCLGKTW